MHHSGLPFYVNYQNTNFNHAVSLVFLEGTFQRLQIEPPIEEPVL